MYFRGGQGFAAFSREIEEPPPPSGGFFNTFLYLKKLLMTPHLDSHSATDDTPEMLSAV